MLGLTHLPDSVAAPLNRHPSITRRHGRFWPLWLTSILLPLFVLTMAAWWTWSLEQVESRTRLARTVDMLREHALRTFEIQDALLIAAQGYTATMSWDDIASSRAVAGFLRELDESTPDLSALGIISPSGNLLHHSRTPFPLRATDLSDREYFTAQHGTQAGIWIGKTIAGRVNGRLVFTYSRPRRGVDGKPDGGVFWASFPPNTFTDFYASIVETPGDTVALIRNDGAVLAQYPTPAQMIGYRLTSDSAPMRAAVAAVGKVGFAEEGVPSEPGPRLYAARQLDKLPLSIVYGLHPAGLRLAFLRDLRTMAAVSTMMMASLLALTWVVTRRARREADALEHARIQAELRALAEAALRRGQRLEILGQIAAGVAHDFRNVTHTVRGGLDLVRLALDKNDLGRAKVVIDMVAESAERGAGLTERMLRMLRAPRIDQNGPSEVRAETSEAVAAIRTATELLAPAIGRNCIIRIQAETTDRLRVHADPAELEAALLNLMLNARDAMPDGGEILISIATEDIAATALPHPEGLRPGRYARITLFDTGIGMDAETLARAMDPFFTTKSEAGGTGLGLATTRVFARTTGGALRLESAGPGHGTIVTLWLPQVRDTHNNLIF